MSGTDIMLTFKLLEGHSGFSWIPASSIVPCLVHSYLGKKTVRGRGDEALSEAALSEATVLSSREQSQDSGDLVLGLYGGIGQTGSEAVCLNLLRTLLTGCAISASPLGPLVGSWSEEALEGK